MTRIHECGHVAGPVYHNVAGCLLAQEVREAVRAGNPARLVRIGREHGMGPAEVSAYAREVA